MKSIVITLVAVVVLTFGYFGSVESQSKRFMVNDIVTEIAKLRGGMDGNAMNIKSELVLMNDHLLNIYATITAAYVLDCMNDFKEPDKQRKCVEVPKNIRMNMQKMLNKIGKQ